MCARGNRAYIRPRESDQSVVAEAPWRDIMKSILTLVASAALLALSSMPTLAGDCVTLNVTLPSDEARPVAYLLERPVQRVVLRGVGIDKASVDKCNAGASPRVDVIAGPVGEVLAKTMAITGQAVISVPATGQALLVYSGICFSPTEHVLYRRLIPSAGVAGPIDVALEKFDDGRTSVPPECAKS